MDSENNEDVESIINENVISVAKDLIWDMMRDTDKQHAIKMVTSNDWEKFGKPIIRLFFSCT